MYKRGANPEDSPVTSKIRQEAPCSPISSKAQKQIFSPCASPKNAKKLTVPTTNIVNTTIDARSDDSSNNSFLSPLYNRESVRESLIQSGSQNLLHDLQLEEDDEVYNHMRLLLSCKRKRYFGAPKLPALSDPNKYTLVLDLDETLVHCEAICNSSQDVPENSLQFNLLLNGKNIGVSCNVRPYVHEFLARAAENYDIAIFTASQKQYADRVIDLIDPQGFIKHRLYRRDCTNVCYNFLKDLSSLGRDLKKVVFIDNSPPAFTYQINNGIPILSWYNDTSDRELKKMSNILDDIRTNYDDVREYIRETFQIKSTIQNLPDLNAQDYEH